MTEDVAELLHDALAEVGARYGFTAEQMVEQILAGDVPHPDAPSWECGMVSPRDTRLWCRRRRGHGGDHWPYRFASEWPEDARALLADGLPFLPDVTERAA